MISTGSPEWSLNSDQIAVFVVAALAAVVLWFVIRRTRVGLEMRAVVDRESLANIRGVNASRTSASAWIMTMILAGLGGVLIAPLFQLDDFVFTLVVLGSLAAVVLGGLRSIPIAFAGGLALGVVQNLVAGYSDDVLPHWLSSLSGLQSSVPFLLVIVLLLFVGRDRSRRAGSVADDVPPPDHRDGMSKLRRRLPWAVWTVVLVAFSMGWFGWDWLRADVYDQTVIAQSLVFAIIFLSFVVVTGMSGQVSLMQASFVTRRRLRERLGAHPRLRRRQHPRCCSLTVRSTSSGRSSSRRWRPPHWARCSPFRSRASAA